MESIAHIVSPLNAAWSGWVMLILMLFAIISEYAQPGVITQAVSSLRPRIERTYKDAPTNFLSQTLITLFRVGTLAMALCLSLCSDKGFTFGAFIALCMVIVVVLVVKMLCNVIVDYTFMLSRRFTPVYEHYSNILTIVACLLFPCLLVLLRIGSTEGSKWVLGIAAVLFMLLWIYRSARTYINSPIAIIYFLLYIVTMELLPLGLLFYLSSQTIQYL